MTQCPSGQTTLQRPVELDEKLLHVWSGFTQLCVKVAGKMHLPLLDMYQLRHLEKSALLFLPKFYPNYLGSTQTCFSSFFGNYKYFLDHYKYFLDLILEDILFSIKSKPLLGEISKFDHYNLCLLDYFDH